MLEVLGWILVGAALTGALLYFWDDIKAWLNNTAANVVEQYIGYDARKAMQRAICVVDRVVNKIRTRSKIYYKRDRLDTLIDEVTIEATAPVYEFDEEVLDAIKRKGKLEEQFVFKA